MYQSKSEKIKLLKQQIEFESSEEQKNVELFRPLIKEADELSKSFFLAIINKSKIKKLNQRMKEYADIANHHQRNKIELENQLRELERSEN